MADELKISKEKPTEPVLNYEYLRQEGMKYISQLSGKIWTDHNLHDPGVTILELLCYAITDLGYRTSYPIKDLIAAESENEVSIDKQFYTAKKILPVNPVTESDYRKLIIDVNGVRNAWITDNQDNVLYVNCTESRLSFERPAGATCNEKLRIKGIYDVKIDIEEDTERTEADIIKDVMDVFHNHRNLCEDLSNVQVIQKEKYIVCAEIDVDHDADIECLQAKIFHNISNYLSPSVRFYSLKEMLDKGKSTEQVFNGPVLMHGFIDDDELEKSSLREKIYLSDITGIIMSIKGVKAVRNIIISKYNQPAVSGFSTPEKKWIVEIPTGKKAVLDTENSRIVFYKDIVPFIADSYISYDFLNDLKDRERAKRKSSVYEDMNIPAGRYRNISKYYSIQNHFPLNYGISEAGLPASATVIRKAQAKQLKAYLLFYDQLLANYLSQLANVRELFSMDYGVKQTYFTQILKGISDIDDLYADYQNIQKKLQQMTEDRELFEKRRNRFLDHLLARFNENFNEYAWMIHSVSRSNMKNEMIKTKLDFLNEYSEISCNRAKSFDYREADNLWDTYNVTGFEHRVARLLGIRNYKRRNLYNIKYQLYEEKDSDNITEYRFRIIDDKDQKILLSSSTRYKDEKSAIDEMKKTLDRAMKWDGYELKMTSDGRYYFNVINERREVVARRIEYFKTSEQREKAIEYLIEILIQRYSNEGMFVVEHLLLRPKTGEDDLMNICVSADCSDCNYADPYSFRITVVLPAWNEKFSDYAFRRFAEKTIRLETPAHILPRICWIDQKQMAEFENCYKEWLLSNVSGNEVRRKKALKNINSVLSGLRSVYEEATLPDCRQQRLDSNPVILDRTNI